MTKPPTATGGEVDVLIISDSSLALVPDPAHGKASCFSAGDLLEPWGEVRRVFTKLLWGKGLRQIVDYLLEAIDDVEANNRTLGRPVLPILVVIVWTGNDVYGEGGYSEEFDGSTPRNSIVQMPTGRSLPTGVQDRSNVLNSLAMVPPN